VPPPAGFVITPSTKQPIRSASDTVEFRRNYGANEFMNALYALDHGYRGQGVTVAVLDDGVVDVNGELDGRIDTALSKDFGYVTAEGVKTKRDSLGDSHSDHGTAVANIIAGAANGSGAVGFAPEAKVAVLRISDWNEDTKTETLVHSLEAYDFAASKGFKIINSSLSSGGAAAWGEAVARFGKTGGLVINSAGNSSGDSPADAAAINDSNRNAVLFVVALSPAIANYQVESYSNKAGALMDRAVAAVGTNVTTLVDGTTGTFSGTSSAAPTVTGLAADILSKWPQLTGQQAGDVILSTAKDIGDPGVDAVYGHGLVDFKAALAPVNPTLSNGTTQTSINTAVMGVPPAMSTAAIQTALSNVTVLDQFGRDFAGSLADLVITPEIKQNRWLRRRLDQMGPGGHADLVAGGFQGSFGFTSTRVGPREGEVRTTATAGSVSFTSGRTALRAGWNAQDSLQSDVMGLAPFADGVLAYAPQAGNSVGVDRFVAGGKLGLTIATGREGSSKASATTIGWSKNGTDLRLSYIDEDSSIMGAPTGEGALRLGRGARTVMVEAHRTVQLFGLWGVEGYGSVGITRLKIDPVSLVTGSTPILGSRVGLQATGPMLGGMLSFGIAQPLTIEAGAARLTYGQGYDLAAKSLTYATTDASLAGERRVQLTAGFARGGPRSSFRIGVMQDLDQPTTRALAGWSARF